MEVAGKKMKYLKGLANDISSKEAEEKKANFTVSMSETRVDRAKKDLESRHADLKAGKAKLNDVDEKVSDIKANITVKKDSLIRLEDAITKQTFELDKDKLKFEDMGRSVKRLIDKIEEHELEEKSLKKENERISEEVDKVTMEQDRLSKQLEAYTKASGDLKNKMDDKIVKVKKAWEELKEFRVDKSTEPSGNSWDEIAQKWIHGNYVDDDRVPETRELVENQYKRAKDAEAAYNEMEQKIKNLKEMSSDIDRQLKQFNTESAKVLAAANEAGETAKKLISDTKKQEEEMKDFAENTIGKAKKDLEKMTEEKKKAEASLQTAEKTLHFTEGLQKQQKSHVHALEGYVSQAEMSLDHQKMALKAAQDATVKIGEEVQALLDEEKAKKADMETTQKSLMDRIKVYKAREKELFKNRPEAVKLHGLKPTGSTAANDVDDSMFTTDATTVAETTTTITMSPTTTATETEEVTTTTTITITTTITTTTTIQTTTTSTATTTTTSPYSGVYNLKSVLAGLYMNVAGNSMNNGGNIQLWDNYYETSTQWELSYEQGKYYVLTNVHSGKVLNVQGDSMNNGGNVHQWDNPGNPSSQWSISAAETDGAVLIANERSGKLANIQNDAKNKGANVHQWDNPENPSSQWYLEPLPEFPAEQLYNLKSVLAGKVLNVAGNSMNNGGNMQLWDNPGDTASQWRIIGEQGKYNIINVHSGKYLNVQGDSMNNGGNIHQWDNPSNPSTQWSISVLQSNKNAYLICNVRSGRLMNIQNDAKNNGANVHQWDNPENPSSQWYLEEVTTTTTTTVDTSCKCYHCGSNKEYNNANVCGKASNKCGPSKGGNGCWTNRDSACVCKTQKLVQPCTCYRCGGMEKYGSANICGAASNKCGPNSPKNGGCWNDVDGAVCKCQKKQTVSNFFLLGQNQTVAHFS